MKKEKTQIEQFGQDLDQNLFEGVDKVQDGVAAFSRLSKFKKDIEHEKQTVQLEALRIAS